MPRVFARVSSIRRLGAAELVGRDNQFGGVDGLRHLPACGRSPPRQAEPRAFRRCPRWRRAAAASTRAPSTDRSRASRIGRAASAARPAHRHAVPVSSGDQRVRHHVVAIEELLADSESHRPVDAWRAAAMSESVTLLIADVTTTTWWPLLAASIDSAARPSDDPFERSRRRSRRTSEPT